jgi:predicted nucleotidyltransferase
MNEKDFAEKNKILKIRNGSHLYGTNTDTSDEDFSGIFITNEDYYFGLYKYAENGEADFSKIAKLDNGKNSKDAIDIKLYELRRFAKLAVENNPNIIEHLYVNKKNIIFCNEYGQQLLDNAHLFPSKRAYVPFKGYAHSQKHKMIIKEKHFMELTNAIEYFSKQYEISPNTLIVELRTDILKFANEDTHHFVIGDLNFPKHLPVKKVKSILKERLSKVTNRIELVMKYGYDTKFGSHWIRLIQEGIDILNEGRLEFPLKNADLILDIKKGKYKIDELIKLGEEMLIQLDESFKKSKLPEEPYFNDINRLVVSLGKSHLSKYG